MNARRTGIVLFLILAAAASAAACNYIYTLIDSQGREVQVVEGGRVSLTQGEHYVLRMEYRENHRNCTVTPEETLYLLDGARWRLGRETQPLLLSEIADWTQPASRTHLGEFTFTASTAGNWLFEVVRTCDRGGYHGSFHLEVGS